MNQYPNYKPGFLEKWGRSVLYKINRSRISKNKSSIENFSEHSTKIIRISVCLSFCIGFIPSFLFVALSHFIPKIDHIFSYQAILPVVVTTLLIGIFTYIEFYLLFLTGLYQAFYMAESANLELSEEPELITPVPGLLARIALEIPDPELRLFGINPYKRLNRKKIFIKTLLYKIKVMISNLFAKIILKAIFGRTGLRIYIEYIAAPITGLWDAYVTYKILHELRMRIISRKIAEKILIYIEQNQNQFSPKGKECLMRAIANSIVFTKTFHPNFEYLLLKLVKVFNIPFDMNEMDEPDQFINSLKFCAEGEKRLAIVIFLIGSCFDGTMTKEEWDMFPKFSFISDLEQMLSKTKFLLKSIRNGKLLDSIRITEEMLG
ncbi:MAG: hypothetical protein SH817_07660 [Leptospira sp.]|nr:hypothetical protein [Leptospira sp.]